MLLFTTFLIIISGCVAIYLYKDILNPIALFSFGLAANLLATAMLNFIPMYWEEILGIHIRSKNLDNSQFIVSIIILCGWLAFCCSCLVVSSLSRIDKPLDLSILDNRNYNYYKILKLTNPIIAIVLILYICFFNGYLPIWEMLIGNIEVAQFDQKSYELPIGIMSIIVVFTMVYAMDLSETLLLDGKNWVTPINMLSISLLFFLSIWNGKRLMLLFASFVFIVGYINRWSFDNSFHKMNHKLHPLVVIIVGIIFISSSFILVDRIRYQSINSSNVFKFVGYASWPVTNMLSIADLNGFKKLDINSPVITNYYKDFSPRNELDREVTSMLMYRSKFFSTPETLSKNSKIGPRDIKVPFVFTELVPARLGGKLNIAIIRPFLFEPGSPSGFFTYWWLDGGLPFVMFGGGLFGVLAYWIYELRHKSVEYWHLNVLCLWALATSGTYNHFLSLNYFWLPAVIVYIRIILRKLSDA